MPSAAARRLYEDQIPSFMSVFDLDAETMGDQGTVTFLDAKFMGLEAPKLPAEAQPQLRPAAALSADAVHRHQESTSTQATESAESSPTTTASCTDSSSLSDPSPSSSPDSPINLAPLSSFGPAPFNRLGDIASLTVSEPSSLERPMTSPAPRRPKNMKGLSIQPPFNSLSSTLASEPSSPSFIKPAIPAMKRKPSQLSLKTSTSDLRTRTVLEMPSSPSVPPILQRRALKHSTSSPHMLSSLISASFGPVGGMTFPPVLERNETGLSAVLRPLKSSIANSFDSTILEEDSSPIKTQIAHRAAYEFEPFHEIENNEDQKTPGYPDGPIAIYGDNVYLYLEPSAEEAARFDVVINVAREVANPFKYFASSKKAADATGKANDDSPIPDTAVTTASFATAFEFLPDEGSERTPTTLKPASSFIQEPEYIHVLWDHNTDIGQDLMTLCETIDKRTKEGKKVLVHCQQGASRSASLIIAYGMYQNPELSVNDAYYAVQAKSQWVSPNMRLMYCLQDFQKELAKRKLAPGSAFRPWSGRSPTKHRLTLSADNIDVAPKEPLTAPLPGEDSGVGTSGRTETSPNRPRGNSSPDRGEPISPGPSSAPSSFSWSRKESEAELNKFPRLSAVSTASLSHPPPSSDFGPSSSLSRQPPSTGFVPLTLPRPPPSPGFASFGSFHKPPPSPGFGAHRFGSKTDAFRLGSLNLATPAQRAGESRNAKPAMERQIKAMRSFPDHMALMSPRAETMTSNPIHQSFKQAGGFTGMQFVEVPPTPSEGLFSPRESMFPRDPFFPFGRPTQNADPRSPPTKGETPIVRSIDELL